MHKLLPALILLTVACASPQPKAQTGSTQPLPATSPLTAFKKKCLADEAQRVSVVTGVTFTVDDSLTDAIVLMPAEPANPQEAHNAFVSALAMQGLMAIPRGDGFVVVDARDFLRTQPQSRPGAIKRKAESTQGQEQRHPPRNPLQDEELH